MSDFDINAPTQGKVTLELDWDEAEILARIVGMTNSGNLDTVSPVLAEFVASMVEHVGRNIRSDARKYYAYTENSVVGAQVYVDMASNW
jgi:hypothetical protein